MEMEIGPEKEIGMEMEMEMDIEMVAPRIRRCRSFDRFDEKGRPKRKKIRTLFYNLLYPESPKSAMPMQSWISDEDKSATKEEEIVETEAPDTVCEIDSVTQLVESLTEQFLSTADSLTHLNPLKITPAWLERIKALQNELCKLQLVEQPESILDPETESTILEQEDDMVARYRRHWKSAYGGACGKFEDITSLSPMLFTHCTPRSIPECAVAASTLQVYSIKVAKVREDLGWPLDVYGVVAARDSVDRKRNLIFFRRRDNCQTLTEKDLKLRLIGPSRAIVFHKPVHFEIQLKVKGKSRSQDISLISRVFAYNGTAGDLSTYLSGDFGSLIDLSFQKLDQTVQATIMNVQVNPGYSPWPFQDGGKVVSWTESSRACVVLLDSQDGVPILGNLLAGFLHLSRRVVSVELQGQLRVSVQSYSSSGGIAERACVSFTPKMCGISKEKCCFGGTKVEVTVGWSLLVHDKGDIMC